MVASGCSSVVLAARAETLHFAARGVAHEATSFKDAVGS